MEVDVKKLVQHQDERRILALAKKDIYEKQVRSLQKALA
jgi:hypothetical protein